MRLLYIANEYPPAPHGGIGIFVRSLAQSLAHEGHEVAVAGLDPGRRQTTQYLEEGVRVLRLAPEYATGPRLQWGRYDLSPGIITGRVFLSRQVARFAREFRPDLVESHDWCGPLWFAPLRPLIVRLHGAHTLQARHRGARPGRVLRFLERRNVQAADALIAVSEHIGRATLAALGLPNKPFEVIYHGVDCNRFRPLAAPKDPGEILYVGTIHERKGVRELFSAVRQVLAEVPGSHVTVVGRLPSGSDGATLTRQLITSLPAAARRRVRFAGPLPHEELPKVYSRAAAVVFPSRFEAFGLARAEAMACGAAVVTAPHTSGPELIEHENSGLLADPANPIELAEAIVRLLRDHSLRRRLGEQARRRALERFNLAAQVQRNVAFYEKVVANSRPAWPLKRTA